MTESQTSDSADRAVTMVWQAWQAVARTLEAHAAAGGYPPQYIIRLAEVIRTDAKLPLG